MYTYTYFINICGTIEVVVNTWMGFEYCQPRGLMRTLGSSKGQVPKTKGWNLRHQKHKELESGWCSNVRHLCCKDL